MSVWDCRRFVSFLAGLACCEFLAGCGVSVDDVSEVEVVAGESAAVRAGVTENPRRQVEPAESSVTVRPPVVARKPRRHSRQNVMLTRLVGRLHHEALSHFYSDPRNGYARLPSVYERIVRKWQTPYFSPGDLGSDEPIPHQQVMLKIHRSSLKDFESPSLLKPKTAKTPKTAFVEYLRYYKKRGKKFDPNRKVWEAKSLDLIGLIKHPEPVAYVSETIPAMDKLDSVPTRKLDEFESSGLSVLYADKDLYTRTDKGVIRLLGAVRAKTSCLKCHEKRKSGDLLGAFSYTLREARYKRRAARLGRRKPKRLSKSK